MTRARVCIRILVLMLGMGGVAHALTCGDAVTGSVTLTEDLICESGHGVRLRSGATLDCAGYTITGGEQPGQYGIYLRDASDAVVQNCIVERFEVGIRLRGATGGTVRDSVAQHNAKYGIEITRSSTGALIQRNTVYNNSDEGIHVSGPTDGDASHQILENTVDNNANEGIYLVRSDANVVSDNAIRNQGRAGIYVKESDRNSIQGNTLTNDPVQLVSGSTLNVLADNTIIGQRIKFDGSPNNTVSGMSVIEQGGRPSNAYVFNNSPNNTVDGSEACDPVDYHIRAAKGSWNIVFQGFFVSDPPLRSFVDGTSDVTVDLGGSPSQCGISG